MTELETTRHSAAHVLASAILRIWPEAQFAAGPPVANGFYYDVRLDHRISPEDFKRIEKEMKAVVKRREVFERREISRDEAIALGRDGRLAALGSRSEPSVFKLDILEGIPEDEVISLYQNGDFIDLCAGPHLADTSKIGAFKLTHVASAYYKGDESNPQLQRIYGTAFPTKEELEAHFAMLEEAKKRDHRKLGRELDLFLIDEEVGQGLVLWTPKGSIIRHELESFIGEELKQQGYQQVHTPHIGRLGLYRTSGHFPYYSDSQFSPIIERETLHKLSDEGCSCSELSNRLAEGAIDGFLLKPMNCPMHVRLFASHPRSYRELPLRLAEFGTVYRWEQSGELNGMTRVRGFTQDDAHIFCMEDQMDQEIESCLRLVKKVLSTFGLEDYRVRIGLRDPASDKYTGTAENWQKAEAACQKAAKLLDVAFTQEEGEAAFYGPKIDFVVKDVLGRDWQLGTVQVDFNLPEKFDLNYVGSDGEKHRPVMIHRAPFGSLERFTGVLIEHFAGAFPLWLSPEQVRILPVSEKLADYAREVEAAFEKIGVRVSSDQSAEKLGAKIRLAQLSKVPYMLIVGAKEESARQVSVRSRKDGDLGPLLLDDFIQRVQSEITNRHA
ncbi:MAG: threonine--tRNA ligase [Chthoniobacterales bacterium]